MKSFLGVSTGKFFEFIVTSTEIYLDPDKIKAIQDMQPPRNLNELRGFQGRLAYIHRFIVNLSSRCQSFTWLMKKGVSFVWDDACQKAFEDIKVYLTKPQVLASFVSEKPFLLYVRAIDHSLGTLLAQKNDEPCSNKVIEYNVLLIGLQLAQQMEVQYLEAYGDSKLTSTKSRVNMRSIMKTSYLITMQPFSWLIHLKVSTSVIYPASKIQKQML